MAASLAAANVKKVFSIPGIQQPLANYKGQSFFAIFEIDLDNSYPDEGYVLTAGALGVTSLVAAYPLCMGVNVDTDACPMAAIDNGAIAAGTIKILMMGAAGSATGLTELTAAADLSTKRLALLVTGIV